MIMGICVEPHLLASFTDFRRRCCALPKPPFLSRLPPGLMYCVELSIESVRPIMADAAHVKSLAQLALGASSAGEPHRHKTKVGETAWPVTDVRPTLLRFVGKGTSL